MRTLDAVGRGQCIEQAADARAVHLDADEVALRIPRRGESQLLAVAEADLQHALGALRPKTCVEVARRAGVVQAVARPVIVERALLRRR